MKTFYNKNLRFLKMSFTSKMFYNVVPIIKKRWFNSKRCSVISNHFKPRLICNRHVIFQLQNSTGSCHVTSTSKKIPENHQKSQKPPKNTRILSNKVNLNVKNGQKWPHIDQKRQRLRNFLDFCPKTLRIRHFKINPYWQMLGTKSKTREPGIPGPKPIGLRTKVSTV